jgi:hypothetical protein
MNEEAQADIHDAVGQNEASGTELAEYTQTERDLIALEHRLKDVAYDLTTVKGQAAAKKDRAECRTLRVGLDKLRLRKNEDDQARIKARNDSAKILTARIEALEDPIDQQIKADEQRRENERIAKAKAEKDRADALISRITTIRNFAVRAVGKDSAYVREKLALVEALQLADFEEMTPDATIARTETIVALHELLAVALEHEQAVADLAAANEREAAQKAENERLTREARERQEATEAEQRRKREVAQAAEDERRRIDEAVSKARDERMRAIMRCLGASSGVIQEELDTLRRRGVDVDHATVRETHIEVIDKLEGLLATAQRNEAALAEQRRIEAEAKAARDQEAAEKAEAERVEREAAERAAAEEREKAERQAAEVEAALAAMREVAPKMLDLLFRALFLCERVSKARLTRDMTKEADGLAADIIRECGDLRPVGDDEIAPT